MMTLVAAAALQDRVFISADCRVTPSSGGDRHYDNTLKLFRCGPFTVVGFAGHVGIAEHLVRTLQLQTLRHNRFRRQRLARKRVPWHPARLHRWIPRLLHRAYKETKSCEGVSFLVASVVPHVSSVIQSRKAADIVAACEREGRQIPNWAEGVLASVERSGLDKANVVVTSDGAPRLLVVDSPTFEPRFGFPLSFAAIGTGGEATKRALSAHRAQIFAGDPEMARLIFDVVVQRASRRERIDTVGGLYPMYEITVNGAVPLDLRTCSNRGIVELARQPNGNWIQRSSATGQEIEITPPAPSKVYPAGSLVFDEKPYPWFE